MIAPSRERRRGFPVNGKRLIVAASMIGAVGLALLAGVGHRGTQGRPRDAHRRFRPGRRHLPPRHRASLVIDYEVWNIQYATLTDKAASDFHNIPGLATSWKSSNQRQDVDVHAPPEPEVVRRAAAHVGRRRLHDQPRAERGVAQLLVDGREHHGVGAEPAHGRPPLVGARPQAADDGRLHRPEARLRARSRRRT